MSKVIGGLTGAQKGTVDARQKQLMQQQEQRLKQQEADQDLAEEERRKKEQASTRARRGRSGESLLSGLETGVTPVADGRRVTLG